MRSLSRAVAADADIASRMLLSLAVGSISLVLSVLNMILDFPKQLFDIAQREGEVPDFDRTCGHLFNPVPR